MLRGIDHATIVVQDMDEARKFFELLGFTQTLHANFSGDYFEGYMGVADVEVEHTTMRATQAERRQEVKLLRFIQPDAEPDPVIDRLDKLGFNHVCFAVDDIEAEVARLRAAGVQFENEITQFDDQKFIFFRGPGGVTLELAQEVGSDE